MKKNPVLLGVAVLLLMSAFFMTPSAYAADDDYKFCVKGKTDPNFISVFVGQYKISDYPTGAPESYTDYTCYDYWYKDGGSHSQEASGIFDDAWSHITNFLGTNPDNAAIYIVSDLYFAGKKNVNGVTVCNEKDENGQQIKNAFMGKMLSLEKSNQAWIEGRDYEGNVLPPTKSRTISGLCYITEYDSSAAFVRRLQGDYSQTFFRGFTFKDAYFKSTNQHSGVGIISSAVNVQVKSNYFQYSDPACLKIVDSEFYGNSAGAVLGKGAVYLSHVKVENVKVQGVTYAGGLVGYIDDSYYTSSFESHSSVIQYAKVVGDISVLGGDGSYAGGLIGYMKHGVFENLEGIFEDNYKNKEYLGLTYNYSKGDITGGTGSKLGYLVGGLNDNSKFDYNNLYGNYHYGKDDVKTRNGIGTFSDEEWRNPEVNTDGSDYILARNFRNELNDPTNTVNLIADGNLRYDPKPVLSSSGAAYYNGVIPAEQMKTLKMAAVLNIDELLDWYPEYTIVPGENDGLPIFTNDTYGQVYPIGFDLSEFNSKGDPAHKKILKDSIAQGYRQSEYIDETHNGIVVYTDYKGSLNENDVKFVNSLLNDYSEWEYSTASSSISAVESSTKFSKEGIVFTYKTTQPYEQKYFCFKSENNNTRLSFRQIGASAISNGEECFEYWYNDDDGKGAYFFAQNWLNKYQGTVVLTSDIEFAGKTTDGNGTTTCNDAPNAFKGKYLELGALDSIRSEDGKIDTISGLCYKAYAEDIGFVKINDYEGILSNVAFSDVYFKVTGNYEDYKSAGVIWFDTHMYNVSVGNLFVENSEFSAPYVAGAVVGYAQNLMKISGPVVVKDVKVNGYFAGAVVGRIEYVRGPNNVQDSAFYSNINVSDVTVEGSYVGGIFGETRTSNNAGGVVQKYDSIGVHGSIVGSLYVGGLVGYINFASNGAVSIQKVNVLGNISASASNTNVGGLAGSIGSLHSQLGDITIKNNYLKGNISKNTSSGSGNPSIGYLVGYMDWERNNNLKPEITDNYYFGSNEIPKYGIGAYESFTGTKEEVSDGWWRSSSKGIVTRNFRNAIDGSLSADGVLVYGPTSIKSGDESYSNGVLSSEDMKSRRFAAVLNMGGDNWTIEEGENADNDGLPFFADDSHKPIYPVSFDYSSLAVRVDFDVADFLSAAGRRLEYFGVKDSGFVFYTGYDGKLVEDDLKFIDDIETLTGGFWKSSKELSDSQVYENGKSVYKFWNSGETEPGEGLQFCFYEDEYENVPRLNFSQKEIGTSKESGEVCFDYWYDEAATHDSGHGKYGDAVTFLTDWIKNNDPKNSQNTIKKRYLHLTSNIVFSGNTNGVCNDGKNAFKGKMFSLNRYWSFYGSGLPTISGLCHVTDSEDKVGFLERLDGFMQNINFDSVYFKSTVQGASVGIAANGGGLDISSNDLINGSVVYCDVKNSFFQGTYVGTFFGDGDVDIHSVKISDVEISSNAKGVSYIGGVVGHNKINRETVPSTVMNYCGLSYIILNNVTLKGAYSNVDSYVGGIAGSLELYIQTEFVEDSIKGLSIEGATLAGGFAGQIIYDGRHDSGYLGNSSFDIDHKLSISKSIVTGNIKATQYVGGFCGYLDNTSREKTELSISATYSKGNINGSDSHKSGYLIGSMDSEKFTFTSVRDNYHYGENDASTVLGIGSFTDDDWRGSNNYSAIKRNFRNSIVGDESTASLNPDGLLIYDSEHPVKKSDQGPVSYYRNGIVSAADMKTRRFAAVLNFDDVLWSQDNQKNDSLPIFAETHIMGGYQYGCYPIYTVFFDKTSFDNSANQEFRDSLQNAIDRGRSNNGLDAGLVEDATSSQVKMVLFTDHYGKLDGDEVEFLNSRKDETGWWVDSQNKELDEKRYFSDGNVSYSYSNFGLSVAYHFCPTSNDLSSCVKVGDKYDDYSLNYMIKPVKYGLNKIGHMFSPLIVYNSTDTSTIVPTRFIVKAKNAEKNDVTNDNDKKNVLNYFSDIPVDVIKALDYKNDYYDTLHLYCMLDKASKEYIYLYSDETIVPVRVDFYAYDSLGHSGKLLWSNIIYRGKSAMVPVSSYFMIDAAFGYRSMVNYRLEFRNYSKYPSKYFYNDDFVAIPDSLWNDPTKYYWIWKKASVSKSVPMDSIYKGLLLLKTDSDQEKNKYTMDSFGFNIFAADISESVGIPYNVSFDLDSKISKDTLLVLGDSWEYSREFTLNEYDTQFPKAYIYSNNVQKFYKLAWSNKIQDRYVFGEDTLSEYSLDLGLVEKALGDDLTATDITLYPINPEHMLTNSGSVWQSYFASPILIYSYDQNGNKLTGAKNYLGNIELAQTFGDHTFRQLSRLEVDPSNSASVDSVPQLFLPRAFSQSDTFTFDVSVIPSPGFKMDITKFVHSWSGYPESEKWGYDSGKLKIEMNSMLYDEYGYFSYLGRDYPYFEVQFTPYHYNVDFSFPENVNNYDFFVGNTFDGNGKTTLDWFHSKDNVSAADFKVPSLYDTHGCRLDWIAVGENISSHSSTGDIADEYQYMVTFESDAFSRNKLVPDLACTPSMLDGVNMVQIEPYEHGKLYLKQKLDMGDDSKSVVLQHSLEYPGLNVPKHLDGGKNAGVTFVVDAVPDPGYMLNYLEREVPSVESSGKMYESMNNGDSLTVTHAMSLNVSFLKNTHEFKYSKNASDDAIVFTSPTAKKSGSYKFDQSTGAVELQSLDVFARTDACLAGWALDDKGETKLDVFDLDALRTLDALEKDGKSTETLYAVWKSKGEGCLPKTFKITSNMKADLGSFKVFYESDGKTFEFDVGENGVKIPAVEGIEIGVKFTGSDLYKFEKNVIGVDAKDKKVFEVENGSVFAVAANQSDVNLKVNVTGHAAFKDLHLVFDLHSDDAMFYGNDWKKDGDFASDNGESLSFPTMVYNTDRCLAGWSIKSGSGSSWTDLNENMVDALYDAYPDMGSSANVKLYGRWTDKVDECAGSITRAKAELKHGDIQLVEKVDKSKFVHKFNKNGTMMLPAEIDSAKWTLQASPDSSFMLDSVVVLRQGKKVTVLQEGDNLPKDMENVVLKAYFSKSNRTPIEFVKTDFKQSGNAVKVSFESSLFEVTRGVAANVKIVDKKTDRAVVDSLIGDSVATGFSKSLVLRVHKPGDYKLELTLKDDKASTSYSKNFTVKSAFASFAPESWSMISLVAVDTAAIAWEENPHFYWWNEAYCGEFWQYKTFNRGDEIVGTRGIWYSTDKGQPLVMRSDIEDDDSDIVWKLDSVASGWNLVANPHGWRVNLYSKNGGEHKNADEKSDVVFWRYNAETGEYDEEVEFLEPYEAIWAKVTKPTTWKISGEPEFSFGEEKDSEIGGDVKSLAKATAKNRWTLQAVLMDRNGKRDSRNLLGVSSSPFVMEEPPASMGDHVNLSIVDGKRALAKSIKAPSDDMQWTISLKASSTREGALTIGGIEGVKSLGYKVYVTVDGETTEMQEGESLPVLLKSSSKTATVRVTKDASIVVNNSLIKGLRSAQFGNQLNVSYEAAEGLAGELAKVELLDVKGKVVATASAKAIFGTNSVTMNLPKMGVYVLRVRVGSQKLAHRILVK